MTNIIIWGNGLQYKNEILRFLRENDDFIILSITHHAVNTISDFVVKLYETDPVPWEHLKAKTKYLLETTPEFDVIIVNNVSPKEKYFGNGAYRHIQCEKIKIVKEYLRNLYNPKKNGKRTEEHIIHGSDFESQTEHLLSILHLGTLESYRSVKSRFMSVPHHLPVINNYTIKKIDVSQIFCSVLTGELNDHKNIVVPITETPHYRYACGDKQPYESYYGKYGGTLLTDDHNQDSFDRLIREFDSTHYSPDNSFIILEQIRNDYYRVWDGVHRVAIMRSKNNQFITAAVVARSSVKG